MKKTSILASVMFLCAAQAQAQEFDTNQAVQFGSTSLNGSARFNAMSGAFGAIGGDLSALQVNPAGSAVSLYSMATVTGNWTQRNHLAQYLGSETSRKKSDFNLDQIGALFTIPQENSSSALKKVTLGLAVTNDNIFDNDVYYHGVNQNSIANYFAQHANHGYQGGAVPYSNVELGANQNISDVYDQLNREAYGFSSQQALLGYQSYILEKGGANAYIPNVAPGPYLQQSSVITDGVNAKATGNIAFDFNNKFFIGANLNYHNIDYRKSNQIYESNQNSNITNGVSDILFTNTNYTYGDGFSFSVGALAKVTEQLRVGASYDSPTWYYLNDEFQQNLETNYYTNGVRDFTNVSPNIITVYDKYTLRTPSKLTGSLAYVFGSNGLLSVDYSRKDFSATQYKDDANSYDNINSFYENELKAVNELRVGGEYRIKQVSLRAGYRYVESPYKNTRIVGDLNSVSAGIGYSFANKRLDFSYTFSHQPVEVAYISSGLTDQAKINNKLSTLSLSYNVYF